MLFPFHVPVYLPRKLVEAIENGLARLRIIPTPKRKRTRSPHQRTDERAVSEGDNEIEKVSAWVRFRFPFNFVTTPLIADLFLLAILAIGRNEVHDGTIGAEGIHPVDIMLFFITLAYIAISIDASGLIRYLAFRVLQWGGKVGHRLFFFLYAFFFALGSFIGNDPIILSGTAFLAYMTRVSSNIVHPRAWIYSQFAVANIASAILVSSNPTNLVLAGAFNIKFIHYTANMIVPVVATVILLFPFLLYIVFADEDLIPASIKMHELPEEARRKAPVNPNIPHARAAEEETADVSANEQGKLLSLEEIMNPFLDKGGAAFGAIIMAITLVTILVKNAVSANGSENPVFWITCPAAFIMFSWDLTFGWIRRKDTREIAKKGRRAVEEARRRQSVAATHGDKTARSSTPHGTSSIGLGVVTSDKDTSQHDGPLSNHASNEGRTGLMQTARRKEPPPEIHSAALRLPATQDTPALVISPSEDEQIGESDMAEKRHDGFIDAERRESSERTRSVTPQQQNDEEVKAARSSDDVVRDQAPEEGYDRDLELDEDHHGQHTTLVSLIRDAYTWAQETFPTAVAVARHLPFALVPFAFTMFILVQALVTKGWIPVFAHGWDHWVQKTGTIGAIGGMGFLSVVLCNVSFDPGYDSSPTGILTNCSLPAQTLAPPFYSAESSRLGQTSTQQMARQSAIVPFGPQSTAWHWASTMELSARPSALRWPGSCGAIFWLGSTFMCDASTLLVSIFRSLLYP